MKIPASRLSRHGEPMGPLVDVVFLLLVFFLLAGVLEPVPPLSVDPPEAEHAAAGGGDRLRILLDAGGRIAVEGEVLDADRLAEAVGERIDADGPRAALVEADGHAAVGAVFSLLKALRRLGLEDVRLATRPMAMEADDDTE